MLFLLEQVSKKSDLYIDQKILKDLLLRSQHSFQELWLCDFKDPEGGLLTKKCFSKEYEDAIPLGTIEFVNTYFAIFHNTEMKPIEIPQCLRHEYFLKRKYDIVNYEDIPEDGRWFIKDASKLKSFQCIGNKNNVENIEGHKYQVSEIIDIKSEYRVYFIDGKLYSIANYNGDPCLLPDIELIQNANMKYSLDKDYPSSYTMDVAVTGKGTCIIECHVLFSCGLYTTVLGPDFLQGYIDGKRFVLKV